MKITRLLLENFIGIYHGMGLNKIEIDFSKSNNKLIGIFGENGSGKSTIISQCHVFKESFDDRKMLILDGMDGRKEVDIEANGHLYSIQHIYSKSAQSFIQKDGVELNENGGVRTFEDIVEKELGINKDYFLIGKIGSNSKNFVDLTTTERKNYIGTFLNIEEMIESYKNANEKFKAIKKSMAMLGTELQKYGDKTVLETEISNLEKSGKEITGNLTDLYKKQGSLLATIARDNEELKNFDISLLETKINEKKADIAQNSSIKTTLESELENTDKSQDFIENLTKEITDLHGNIQVNESEKTNKALLISDIKNKLEATKIELSSFANPEDMQKLAEEIKSEEDELNTLKESIKANPQGQFINNLVMEKEDIQKQLLKFIDFVNFLEKYFTDLSKHELSLTKSNIEYFFEETFEDSLKRQISSSRTIVSEKNAKLEELQRRRGIEESYICQLDNLNKRPAECSINDCPFIKDAFEHKDVIETVKKLDEDIINGKKEVEKLSTAADNLQLLETLYKSFKEYYENLPARNNKIYSHFIESNSISEMLNGSIADFQNMKQGYIDNISSAYSDISSYLSVNSKLVNNKKSYKILEDSDSSLREKYKADIESFEKQLEKENAALEGLRVAGETLIKELKAKEDLKDKYSQYIQACSKLASSQTMLSTANTDFKKANEIQSRKIKSETELNEVDSQITLLEATKKGNEDSYTNTKTAISKVEDLQEKLNALNASYSLLETVTSALSPATGIPLILIKTYLEETETIANELLDIAFNGDFQIKFITTEKEFQISVIAKDNVKADIKMASQGEVSITTLSISLALIEQSIGEYNILCLDEIDGPLDASNRSNFINILMSQIEKLGIEQVFVISHNNAFDTADMDMILLKGNSIDTDNTEFMKNKTVIYNSEEI